jgi:small-conductance mechanosensitive channel
MNGSAGTNGLSSLFGPLLMSDVPLLPAAILAVGFPLALLIVTEMLNSSTRRGGMLAPTLRVVRNLVLPALAAMLFVTEVWQVAPDQTASRVVRTLFWVSLLVGLLTLTNDALFGGRHQASMRERVPKLFRDLARVTLVAIGAALIYQHVWQQEIGGALTALGLGSIVVGLALQEPLGNIVSGLMLLLERPLAIGDWIIADGTTGKVIEINWRSVHIESILHEMRIIPNVVLYKESFSNLSRPTEARTDTYDIGFSYDHPPNVVKEAMLGILRTTPGVITDPAPEVHTLNYGDFSISYRMYFTVARQEDVLPVRDAILSRIWYVARRESLQIPFPIQMEYSPSESPSLPQPTVEELLDRFPRYRHVRDAMLQSPPGQLAGAIVAGQPAPSVARIVTYAAGEVIQARGAAVDRFGLIAEGSVDLLSLDAEGAEVVVASLGPGDFHGDATASAGRPSDFRVVARTDAVEVSIDSRMMSEWLQGSSGLAAEIGDAYVQRRKEAQRHRQRSVPRGADPE